MPKRSLFLLGILVLFGLLFLFARNHMKNLTPARPGGESPPSSRRGPGDYTFSLIHDGLTRTYTVHVPPSYDPRRATPVVLYIHGGGGNARAAYLDGVDRTSDTFGFLLAIPEGTGEIRNGELRAEWNGGAWSTGACCGSADDVGFIRKVIGALEQDFRVDPKRIYAMGISNGGLMTNRLGCELADTLAAIATVAPAALESTCRPTRPIPVMDIHGTGDPCNPYAGGRPTAGFCARSPYMRMTPHAVVDQWRALNGCGQTSTPGYEHGAASCVQYGACRGGGEVEFCTITGMGHTWPSGAQYFPASLVGPVSYDIATDQMWDFFRRHPLP